MVHIGPNRADTQSALAGDPGIGGRIFRAYIQIRFFKPTFNRFDGLRRSAGYSLPEFHPNRKAMPVEHRCLDQAQ